MLGFISYSTANKIVAHTTAKALQTLRIRSFLAHDDLIVSDSWRERIVSELSHCDVFVPLLSNDFKQSEWCAMECGYAIGRSDLTIIPISLDGTLPFGFLSAYQTGFVDPTSEPNIQTLIALLREGLFHDHFDHAFRSLLHSIAYPQKGNFLLHRLSDFEKQLHRFGVQQIDDLTKVVSKRKGRYLKNDQTRRTLRRIQQYAANHIDSTVAKKLGDTIGVGELDA